jgi:hypothetical protein
MNNDPNRLHRGYNNFRRRNVPFQNNQFLMNNPNFGGNVNYNQSRQMQQMRQMQQSQEMRKIQQLQYIKKMEKFSDLDKKLNRLVDKNQLFDAVIKYDNNNINRKNNREVEKNYKEKQQNYMKNRDILQRSRTNQPYKNIIKDEKQINKFLNKNYSKKDENIVMKDLIVHKVTDADKEGVDEEFEKLEKELERHDKDLKMIYSTSKEAEYKQKFEYNNKYKYRVKFKPSDHDDMKKDKINYYKKEQKKIEKNRKQGDTIIEDLITMNIIDNDESIDKIEKELEESLDDKDIDNLIKEYDIDEKELEELHMKMKKKKKKRKDNI